MIGIILAGGNGTRFSAEGCCKPLLKLNGKYLIEYPLQNLADMRVKKAVIVVGKYGRDIRAALGERYKGVSLLYAEQAIPAGCIHALYSALPYWNGETVILQLSDEIFLGLNTDAPAVMGNADFLCGYTIVGDKKAVKENYSVFCAGHGNLLQSCEEKPKTVYNNKKGSGFCVFRPVCIRHLQERYDAAFDHYVTLCDFMNHLLADGKTGMAIPIAAEEININTPEKLLYAESILRGSYKNE